MLTAILLGLLVFAMGLIGATSLYFATQTVQELADTIVRQSLRQTETRVNQLIKLAVQQAHICRRITDPDTLSARDFTPLFAQLTAPFLEKTDLTYLGLGLEETGEYCMLERLPDGTVRLREYVQDGEGKRVIRDSIPKPGGRELVQTLPWDGYDPRQRPFYQAAKAAQRGVWTDSYTFLGNSERKPVPGITFALPVYTTAGSLAGVWDVDFDTQSLSAFLKSLKNETPGYAFVVEEPSDGSPRVVAHPTPELLFEATSHQLLTNIADLPDAPARALLFGQGGKLRELAKATSHRMELRVDGRDYLAGTVLLEGEQSPRWLVAVILPTAEVMGHVRDNQRWSAAIFFIGMGLALIAAVRISETAARPLKELQRETEAIGRLELSPANLDPGRILEINQLSTAVDEMKTNLRSFRKYVPAEVVGELVRSGREAVLGGGTATVTIYFSDIEGFTSSSESMTPEAVVAHLGDYLGAMSDGISRHRGTVDKFIGDAVMAFWNAPQPNAQHAADACRAAWENQRTLHGLRERWSREGKPGWRTRIALHTGEVVVGNIGSAARMNYTIIGDNVNLASRLEKVNKQYGTSILLSESTRVLAGDAVVVRPLDVVAVRGRNAGVTCFELVALRGEESAEEVEWCLATAKAFEAYQDGDWGTAVARYAGILKRKPDDRAAKVLLDRCRELQ